MGGDPGRQFGRLSSRRALREVTDERGAWERVGPVLEIVRNKYQAVLEQAGRRAGRKDKRKLELDPGIGWSCVWSSSPDVTRCDATFGEGSSCRVA